VLWHSQGNIFGVFAVDLFAVFAEVLLVVVLHLCNLGIELVGESLDLLAHNFTALFLLGNEN